MNNKKIKRSPALLKKRKIINSVTAIKVREEIIALKKAAKLTDNIFDKIIKNWKEFNTEKDIETFILKKISNLGLRPSFPPIVASGKHACNPHAVPRNKKLERGFCVIDMGLIFNEYCSDMTRTVFIGKPKQKEIELYEKVLEAQIKTIAKVKIGMQTKTLDRYSRKILGKELSKQFIHGLGHGVGTQVHEWPFINSKTNAKLLENMVFTIEPGVYVKKGYGIRIEDTILLTKKGPETLNKSSKKLIIF